MPHNAAETEKYMAKIVTLGELLMRLSTPEHERFAQANRFDLIFGGGEANVAASLAMLGHDATFITKLPDNPIAHGAAGYLRRVGVNTDSIVFGGSRMGIYFLEPGAGIRPSGVIYDRAGSAFSEADESEFDFDAIFEGADLFHISGITPAVSDKCASLARAALIAAKRKGITVSFDVNFRSKLWNTEKAAAVLPELVQYADICFANSWDAANLLDVDVAADAPFDTGSRKMSEKHGFRYVIASKRHVLSASANDYSGMIYSSDTDYTYTSKEYRIDPIVDRVGTGDAFAGGVLCGILDGMDCKQALEFGVAAGALKHSIPGDITCVTHTEVETLALGSGSLRIQR